MSCGWVGTQRDRYYYGKCGVLLGRWVGVVCAAGTNGDNGDAFVAAAAACGWWMVDVLLLLM